MSAAGREAPSGGVPRPQGRPKDAVAPLGGGRAAPSGGVL
jgi:hypothetical protein